MARVTCRCGETIDVDRVGGPDRIVCPHCQARIRVRRSEARPDDGLIRFHCTCGRRLKVRAEDRPEVGRCPDCGTVVPVPKPSAGAVVGSPPPPTAGASFTTDEARTEELGPSDVAQLDRWAARHGVMPDDPGSTYVPPPSHAEPTYAPPPALRVEAGLRVCPKCSRPLHMSAVVCRACGASTPKP